MFILLLILTIQPTFFNLLHDHDSFVERDECVYCVVLEQYDGVPFHDESFYFNKTVTFETPRLLNKIHFEVSFRLFRNRAPPK